MFRTTALALTGTLFLAACIAPPTTLQTPPVTAAQPVAATAYSVAPPNAPSGQVVDSFARAFLDSIQAQSIAENVEYCGYFFIDSSGQLFGTPPIRGRSASCSMNAPQPGQGVVASYHTHGSYRRAYAAEVPSIIDLQSDFQFGIDGYVSTPGGRIWLVDFQTTSTMQVCGRNCVYADPAYNDRNDHRIRQSYTLTELRQRKLFSD